MDEQLIAALCGGKSTEVCEHCAYSFGPLFLACGNSRSEFFEEPIHPRGCCPEFAPQFDEQ